MRSARAVLMVSVAAVGLMAAAEPAVESATAPNSYRQATLVASKASLGPGWWTRP